ncbi:flagellar basal body P-ring formation protein FlgA [Candidatus Poribacteria bacterium]|nr:flagellar basal body P-ring formation protein FlgA [Candidatus Poribacteria bacterium]
MAARILNLRGRSSFGRGRCKRGFIRMVFPALFDRANANRFASAESRNRFTVRCIFIASIVFVFSNVWTGDILAATITLRGTAEVRTSAVRLGDVAIISEPDASGPAGPISAIPLCSAPPPAETLTLSHEAIATALRIAGADVSSLRFAGSSEVVVMRAYEMVTLDELQREFTEYVSRRTGWPHGSYIVTVPKNFVPVPVPAGERAIHIEVSASEDFSGSVLARFQVMAEGRPYCELNHRFGVERYVEALVATHKIGRGQPVTESDVETKEIEQGLVDDESFTHVEQAVGLVAAQTIRPGAVLDSKLLVGPSVIQKGKEVSVTWMGDGFSIATTGRVLEDGRANELVRVRLASKKIVKATVLDSNTLMIAKEGENDERSR